jgi:hypothetical protein
MTAFPKADSILGRAARQIAQEVPALKQTQPLAANRHFNPSRVHAVSICRARLMASTLLF